MLRARGRRQACSAPWSRTTQVFLPGAGTVVQAGRFVFEVATEVETFTDKPLSSKDLAGFAVLSSNPLRGWRRRRWAAWEIERAKWREWISRP